MSLWQPVDGSLIGQAIAETSTTQKAALGQIVRCKDMASTDYGIGEFIYLKGLDATVLGSVVTFTAGSWQTALAVADAIGRIGFAMAAVVTGEYGWYQISGKCVGKVLTGFASGNTPYLTSTAGSVDDTAVAGDEIFDAISVSAIATPAAGLALISADNSFVTNASN